MKKTTSKKEKTVKTKEEKRFVMMKDDDSHLYIIPLELKEKFESMEEEANKNDDHEDFCNMFDQYRTSMHMSNYSFTDPKEIE